MAKYKVGDKVVYSESGRVYNVVGIQEPTYSLESDDGREIEYVAERFLHPYAEQFKVGDVVRKKGYVYDWEIIKIHGDYAWIWRLETSMDDHVTRYPLAELTRA